MTEAEKVKILWATLDAIRVPLKDASKTGFLPTWTNFQTLVNIIENSLEEVEDD